MIRVSVNRQASAGTAIAFARICSRRWRSRAFTALAVVLALPSLAVAQTNGTWNVDANGSWSTTTNWLSNTVASGTNAVANFANVNITTGRTITVDGNYTIGSLNAGDTDNSSGSTLQDPYTFSSGTLTLANTTGAPNINVALGGATGQRRVQFNTILAGTSGLTVTQSGAGAGGFSAVALKGINTFTGNITIGSGTYATGMYLDIGNVSSTGEAAQLGSGNFAGNIDIQGNNQMRFFSTLNNNLSGIISGGTGTIITLWAGTGTTTLSAANTFSGRFLLSTNASGVSRLNLGHANALQNARLEISSTNTLRFSPSIGTFNVGRVSGAGGFALAATDNSAVTLSIGGNSAGASDTISGTISGLGGLTKVGSSGTLTLSASNTYTGTTAVNAGVLVMNNAAALGTGTVTFGGGTLQYGSGITTDLSGRIAASGSAISVDTGTNNVTWATGLASTHTGGLTKLGSGTLTLSNANTYTGTTAVNAGVLQIGNNSTAGGLAASSAITGASGATLAFNRTDDYGGNFTNAISGGLGVRVNSGTLTLSASNAYTGASIISAGRLVVGHVNALGSSTSTLAVNGGTLDLDGRSISVGTLSGSSGATITTNSSSGTATLTTSMATSNTFAGTIADNGSGRVALTKTGAGTLNITGANTFSGDLAVNQGLLYLQGSGLLGASGTYGGAISLSAATRFVFQANGNQTLTGSITSGAGPLFYTEPSGSTVTGTVNIAAANPNFQGTFIVGNAGATTTVGTMLLSNANAAQAATLDVRSPDRLLFAPGIGTFNVGSLNAGGSQTTGSFALTDTSGAAITLSVGGNNRTEATPYTGVIGGLGNLTKVGSGILTLTGANTYTGTTGVNGGVLAMNNAAALGTGTVTFGGGTLQYGSGITTDLSGRIAASGSAIAVDTGANNVTWATGLASTNTGGLTKLGSGVLTFSAANSYSGDTTIRNGAVAVTTPANLGTGTIAITPDAGTTNPSLRLNNTASGTYTQPITMSSINFPAFSVVDASSATAQVTLSGGITLSNNAFLARLVAPTGTTGSLVVDGNITGTGDLQLAGNGGAGVIQKDINIGSATLFVGSNGSTWSIGGGAYTWGTTNIQLAGSALRTTADNVLPSASALVFSSAAGALDINGTRQTVGSVGNSVAGSRIILGSGTLTVSNTNASSFAGVISGAGGSLVKTNSGTLTLSGSSTYSGATTIAAGRLVVGNAAALGSSSAALAVNGGTLDLGGFSVGVGALSGSAGAVITTATTAGTATLTSAVASGTSIFGGVIQDNGSGVVALTKSGAGVLALTGPNTYSGATSVSAGTLLVTGQLGNTAVTVDSGATLGGSGSIAGAVTVNGFLSPGASPGVLSVASLVLGASSTSVFEIDGLTRGTQYDGVNITGLGGPTYGGTLSLSFLTSFDNDTTFDLFNFSGTPTGDFTTVISSGAYAGTWSQVTSGTWRLESGSQTVTFSQATGDIVVVPEPAALALAAIGIAAATWVRRRSISQPRTEARG